MKMVLQYEWQMHIEMKFDDTYIDQGVVQMSARNEMCLFLICDLAYFSVDSLMKLGRSTVLF